jgi:hypothetical protein
MLNLPRKNGLVNRFGLQKSKKVKFFYKFFCTPFFAEQAMPGGQLTRVFNVLDKAHLRRGIGAILCAEGLRQG